MSSSGRMTKEQSIGSLNRTLARLLRLGGSRSIFSRQAAAANVVLSQPAYVLLRTLIENGSLPVGGLARVTHMDVGMATRQLNSLEKARFVTKQADDRDGRVIRATATAKGTRAADALQDVRRNHLEGVLRHWSAADLRQFDGLLTRLVDDLQRTPFE